MLKRNYDGKRNKKNMCGDRFSPLQYFYSVEGGEKRAGNSKVF